MFPATLIKNGNCDRIVFLGLLEYYNGILFLAAPEPGLATRPTIREKSKRPILDHSHVELGANIMR